MAWRVRAVALLSLAAAACDARLPNPESAGAQLYAARCGGCHRLYAPGAMTATMWKLTLARMQGELARRGIEPLTSAETATVLAYLEKFGAGRNDQ